jgi:hypothetical protein
MRLLKKGVPLCWDEANQRSFEALKHTLTCSPLLNPLDYGNDLLLYLASVEYTIGILLVQEDDMIEEHVIYYLR